MFEAAAQLSLGVMHQREVFPGRSGQYTKLDRTAVQQGGDLGYDRFGVLATDEDVRTLATLRDTDMKTFADLGRFNKANCDRELRFFNQSIFRQVDATGGDLTDPIYLRALRRCRRLTRDEGLDRAFGKPNLDAIVGSSFTFLSSPAAVAGCPHIAVPAGYDNHGVPAGL